MDVLFEKNSLGRILQKVREVVIPLHFFNPSLAIVFTTPSVPLVGDRNPFQRIFFESLRLPFQRELHIPLQASPFSEGRGCNRPTRCSNRYAIRLADHQRSAPGFLCGMGPQGHGACDFCWFCCRLLLVVCSFGSYMARLHWEGVASCPPNVEWLIFSVQC